MVSPVLVELKASSSEFMAKMKEARAEITKLGTESSSHFQKLATVGKAALAATAAGAVAVGVESLKMAGDFQASTNVLVTAAGESTKNIGMIRQGILDIAKETGTTWENLTEGMYQVEKAGYRGADGLKVLRAAAEGAREENAQLSDVTNAMTSVMASYHLKATDSVRVMNALKTAAGEGKMTMEEFAASLSTVIPVASANRISFAQVSGAIATLTQHGTSADEATQELSNTIRSLSAPNRVAQNEMQQLGLKVNDVSKNLGKRGLTGTISLLVNAITSHMGPAGLVLQNSFNQSKSAAADAQVMFTKLGPAGEKLAEGYQKGSLSLKEFNKEVKALPGPQAALVKQWETLNNKAHGFNALLRSGDPAAETFTSALRKMMGGATGMNTALMLSGENMAGFKTRVAAVQKSMDDNAKSVEGWTATSKLLNVQIDKVKQTVEAWMIELGTKLIPLVERATAWLNQHRQVLIALAGTIGGALVVAMMAYVAQLTVTVARTVAGFVKMVASGTMWVVQTTAQIAKTLALWVAYGVQWVARTAASIAETMALWAMYGAEWAAQQAAMFARSIAGFVRWAATTVARVTATAAVWIAENGAMAAAAVAAFVAENAASLGIVAALAAIVAGVVYLATHWHQVWNDIKSWIHDAWAFIRSHAMLIAAAFGPVALAITALATHWSTVWNGIKAVIQGAWSVIGSILHAIESAAGAAAGAIGKVLGAASKVGGALGGVGSFITSHLPHFAAGGVVPGALGVPTLAVVHGGETISNTGQQQSEREMNRAILAQLVALNRRMDALPKGLQTALRTA